VPEKAEAPAEDPALPPDVRGFSVQEAVSWALEHNPAMAAADADIEVYDAKLFQAWSAYIPRAKVKSLFTVMPGSRGDAFTGYVDFEDWGPFIRVEIEFGMPIYAFGKLEALRDLARAGIDVAKGKRRVVMAEIVYQTKRAYYTWQFTREVQAVLDDGRTYLEKAKRRLEDMEMRDDPEYDQIDMLKTRVYESDIRARELETDKGAFMAREGLVAILALPRGSALRLTDEQLQPVGLEILPIERYLAVAEQWRPELEAARAGIRAAEHNVDLRIARMLPSIGVVGNYTFAWSPVADDQQSPFSIDPYNTNGGGAALGIEWELDIGQKIGEFDEAKAGFVKAKNEVEFAKSKLLFEVQETWKELTRQSELIEINEKAMRAARGWLIAKSDLYDAGFAELQDVVDALLEFYKRKLGYMEAIYNFNIATAELSRRVGVDVTTLTAEAPVGTVKPTAGE
jgi:outer membrane protein TolC